MYKFQRFGEIANTRILSNSFLGRDISWSEVKFYQYLIFGILNNNILDSNQLLDVEQEYLEEYMKENYLTFEVVFDKILISVKEDFEKFMFDVLDVAYKR